MRKILQSEKTVKRVDTKRADGRTKRADGIEGYLMAVRVSACLLITIYRNNT